MNRREFMLNAAGAMAGLSSLGGGRVRATPSEARAARTPPPAGQRRLIIVVFGGGTRYSESIGDPEHRHIPHLWNDMVPHGALFENVRVDGRIVHTNCTASLFTGHREYDSDNDWSRPVAHPTIFEIYRQERGAADTAVWAFVYASILAPCGFSMADGYGLDSAANVVEPPTIPRRVAEDMAARMQQAAADGLQSAEIEAAAWCARHARANSRFSPGGLRSDRARHFLDTQANVWRSASGTTSHDAFLLERAIACMSEFSPDVLAIAFGEIDCAHYGSWSRYVEAIRRTDALTWRLWTAVQADPAYRGRTLMLIVPDHGRELERPGGMGFIHHSDFYTGKDVDEGCRRVWMLALGPGVVPGRRISEPVPALTVAATGLDYMGLTASRGAATSVLEKMV